MPIYEYHCSSCNEHFEVMQKISELHLAACPKCGKEVKRLISQTAFSLKGGGWYKDGYVTKSRDSKSESKSKEMGAKEKGSTPEKKADKTPTSSSSSKG